MDSCDVLIVGGGPGGSTCARKLRSAGLDAVILDKREFPRDKTCAGWITPAVVAELQLDVKKYAASRVFQPITRFRSGMIRGRAVETNYDKPVSFGIRRFEFDEYLLHRSGARLRLGEKLNSLVRDGSGWVVNGTLRTPLVIGAGGHFCPVARQLGGDAGKETIVAAQEIEFPLTAAQERECRVAPESPELYFCKDLAGYAWCFRKGNYLNVGLGREDNVRVSEHVADFRAWMIEEGRIPRDTPEKFHGHAYILYGHTQRPLVDDGVLLIGDAAGLAYPQSGEGIRPAVESALMAAEVIFAAKNNYSRQNLEPYRAKIHARFGKPRAAGATNFLPQAIAHPLAAKLLTTKWFTKHVVIDRWFLHAQVPALAGT
jgi:geranylgeranyl reductase family protein